jgi:diguanylate cyclase
VAGERALRRRRAAVQAVLAAAALTWVALLLLQPLPAAIGEPLSWALQSVTVLLAGAALLRRARRDTGRLRRARRLVAASLGAGAAGGVLAIAWSVVTGAPAPDPSLVDVVHFSFVPLVVAGLLSFPVDDTRAGSVSRVLLDGTVAAGALWFVIWTVLLVPFSVGEGVPVAVQLTTLAYPAADVFVLGMLAGVLPRVAADVRRELAVIGGGLALFAVADVAYTVEVARGTYRADSWVGLLYEGGLLLVLVGALAGGRAAVSAPAARLLAALPSLPVLAALAVGCTVAVRGGRVDSGQLLAGLVLVAALFLRHLVGSRDRDDLLERLRAREELFRHAAHHDALTGLGNLTQARVLLASSYEQPAPATVVLVDLDGFKAVNDTFGHAHGDALLREVAGRLRGCLREQDAVTRIGGDEFVLVVQGEAGPVVDRLLTELRRPVEVAGTIMSVRASVGVARTAEATGPDEVLRNADLAMYAAKAAGRDRAVAYEPWMHESAAQRTALHAGLRRALDDDLLELHYQPVVRLADGVVVGAEALLRWTDPVHGPVSPADFIPVAEDTGIIGDIDLWVLDRACRDLSAWRASGLAAPQVAVNVSRRHMTAELPGLVAAALERYGLPGSALCVEVTESAVVPDAATAAQALADVRALGVAVALDDFGSGESSLSQLARLPVDHVKIDKSFTQTAETDPTAARLLSSIVGVGQALRLPVVAEGVESAELVDFLRRAGCDRAQGWHFGRPQPEPVFRTRLAGVQVPAARSEAEVAQVVSR